MKVSLKAVAVFKQDYLTAEAVELEIVDGVVVAIRYLTRAPDQHATAVSQCMPILWSTLATNPIYKEQPHEEVRVKPTAKKVT